VGEVITVVVAVRKAAVADRVAAGVGHAAAVTVEAVVRLALVNFLIWQLQLPWACSKRAGSFLVLWMVFF